MDIFLGSLLEVGKALLALLALGAATTQGTEVIKTLWNGLVAKIPALSLFDKRTFVLAAVVAFLLTQWLGGGALDIFASLPGFDAGLYKVVETLLVALLSNQLHNSLPKPAKG